MENEGKLKLAHCPFWLLSAGETEIIFPFSQKNQIFCIHKNQDSISLFSSTFKNMTMMELRGTDSGSKTQNPSVRDLVRVGPRFSDFRIES